MMAASISPAPASASTRSWLASLSLNQRTRFLQQLTDEEAALLAYDWRVWARPNQLPPASDWLVWLLMAGRGFGKTRGGAEWCRAQVETDKKARPAMITKNSPDARDVMVEGESGLLAICPPWNKPLYEPSKRRLTWPNGAMATLYAAEEPATLRGPQHSALRCDELASWKYPEAWDMAQFGLRLCNDPRSVVTTTPRPIKLIQELGTWKH